MFNRTMQNLILVTTYELVEILRFLNHITIWGYMIPYVSK